MTIKDYISGKFETFGIELSDADLLDMTFSSGKEPEEELNSENIGAVSVSMARFIPTLLLRATSVSEGGISMSWNLDGIKEYYSMLCRQYGLKDDLNDSKPKIRFL